MIVRFKKLHPDAMTPTRGSSGAACWDLYAADEGEVNKEFGFLEYTTGIALEIPHGHVGLIYPRSSISSSPYTLANSVGVIDSDYRGPIRLRFYWNTDTVITVIMKMLAEDNFMPDVWPDKVMEAKTQFIADHEYERGDRIGQLLVIPYPELSFKETDGLSNSNRGAGGFGSTGK